MPLQWWTKIWDIPGFPHFQVFPPFSNLRRIPYILYRVKKIAFSRVFAWKYLFFTSRKISWSLLQSFVYTNVILYPSYVVCGRVVIFSVFARCIDPARDRNRVINSLYLSLTSQALHNSFPIVPFTHVSFLFFSFFNSFSEARFCFSLSGAFVGFAGRFESSTSTKFLDTQLHECLTKLVEKKNTYCV